MANASLAIVTPDEMATLRSTTRDPSYIAAALELAATRCHLVSPASSVGQLPEGCSVALSTVMIDEANETYPLQGKRGLSKAALDRVAAAAGVSWDADRSRRLDDGSDPHYCSFLAVGNYRHFDGTPQTIMGTKEMDLREGSAQVEALMERYRDKLAAWQATQRGPQPLDPTAQIREMRLHLVAHAETKARLRAIRALGIRSAYSSEELRKPFVVARLMFTGATDDPALRHEFALMQARAMLGGAQALYGGKPEPRPALPAFHPAPPPPVGTVEAEFDDVPPSGPSVDAPPSEPQPAAHTTAPAAPAPAPTPRPAPALRAAATAQRHAPPARQPAPAPARPPPAARPAPTSAVGPVVKFGRNAGQSIDQVDDRDLGWYADAIAQSVDNPAKAKYREDNLRHLEEIRAEQRRRNGEFEPPDGGGAGVGDDDIPFLFCGDAAERLPRWERW